MDYSVQALRDIGDIGDIGGDIGNERPGRLVCQVRQNGAEAKQKNQTCSRMTLARCINWSGVPAIGSFPKYIRSGGSAHFTHLKKGRFGSSGGVQYNGRNAVGSDCAWIVAWHAPFENEPPCPPNRVYCICGSKEVMDELTWDEIEEGLDESSTSDSNTDGPTKTRVEAIIHDRIPNAATILVDFKLVR